jgi:hypothetical protein
LDYFSHSEIENYMEIDMSKLANLLICSTIISASALFSSVAVHASSLLGQSPEGANDYHILLANPVVPAGGGYNSSPFGNPNYNPTAPPSNTLNYSGSPVPAGTTFSLENWNLVFTNSPSQGSLNVLSTWWTINGVKQTTGSQDYNGINPTAYLQPVNVPEPFTVIGTLIGGIAAFRMRKKIEAIAD